VKYPAYPRTKPSSVDWLGDVPEHWTPIALRRTATRYAGGTPDRSNDSFWDEGTIPWINSGAVNQGLITEPSAFITEEAYRNSSARWVAKGALVMALAGQGKTKGMVAQTGIATTCNQSMAAICPAPPMEARYLYWILVAQYEHIRNMAGGEARDGLNLEILGAIPCLKVPPAEQRSIAAFLDRETGRVDRLVAKKRELIERLKEKRTALISRTVTRGLPPAAARAAGLPANPPLKPTALDWLGDIPKHWEVLPFTKYVAEKSDYRGKTPDKQPDGVFLVTARNVRMGFIDYESSQEFIAEEDYGEVMRRGLPKKGDILFTTEAPLGNVALVDREDIALAQRIIRFRMSPAHYHSAFVLFAMMSDHFQVQLKSLSTGSTAEGLKASKLPILRLIAPPLPEQAAIAAYLDEETAKLDALVGKVEEAAERLQEYRTALITAAVTGKIDVRTEIAP
jgi:type I restriction enzyme S subunit